MEPEQELTMHSAPFLLHALSPLHAGTGHAADIIDLPTARMKATGIPFVPGSSIKGVLRDAHRGGDAEKVDAVFGPWDDPGAHAGAVVVGDARLLALPVRTFRGAFAWTTSPLLLVLAGRDLGTALPVPSIPGRGARVPPGSVCVHKDRLYLEDLDLPARESSELEAWARVLAPQASPGQDIFSRRLAAIDDDTMAFLCETATQIDARVRLDTTTRTVQPGALWFEESLPPETLLISLIAADRSRRKGVAMTPEEVLAFAVPDEEVLQFGGRATTGHGRCRIVPIPTAEGVNGR
jgi:CRISPR-associated protein Cmr4